MQQRTSVLPPSHPVRALQGLARQIALPHEYQPERFPSFPALERTAVNGFSVPTTLALPANATTKIGISRQAAYPAWAEQSFNNTMDVVTYISDEINPSTGAICPELCSISANIYSYGNANRVATVSLPGISGVSSTPLPYPTVGVDSLTGAQTWTYVPQGSNFTFLAGMNALVTGTTTIQVVYEVWTSPGEIRTASSPTANISSNTYSALIPGIADYGWIRPKSVSALSSTILPRRFYVSLVISCGTIGHTASGSTQGILATSGGATTLFRPLCYPVEFSNSTLPWFATRTTAAGFLGSNVSQVLNKGGTVLAGRISPNVVSIWDVTSTYVNGLHPAEKAFLPLETGVYTYVPPSTDLVNFWDYTAPSNPGLPVYRLDNDSMCNVMYVTASAVAETLACTIDWHIEFRTSSALFPIGLCTMTLETLHQAQIALAAVGFFFENPDHKKILSSVIGAVKKYGPGLVSMVNPAAGVASKMLISSMPGRTNHMKPSSGTASGIVPAKSKSQHKTQRPKPKVTQKPKRR